MASSFKLKLLRGDVSVGSLPILTEDNYLSPPAISRKPQADCTNDVKVQYVQIVGFDIPSIVSVSCDDISSMILLSNGEIWVFGCDCGGWHMQQVDSSDQVTNPIITKPPAGVKFVSARQHWEHVSGVDENGQLWCWGGQDDFVWGCGAFWNPPDHNPDCPWNSLSAIAGGGSYQGEYSWEIASLTDHHANGLTGGKIYGWGYVWSDSSPQGLGPGSTHQDVPMQEYLEKTDWVYVNACRGRSFAIDSTGKLYVTGWGTPALGTGNEDPLKSFTLIDSIKTDWVAVSGGDYHTLALDSSGRVWSWGWNDDGQCGFSDPADILSPQQVPPTDYDNKVIVQVATSQWASYILASDGALYVTGYGYGGQLGLGDENDVNQFTEVTGHLFTYVAGGHDNAIAVKTDGTVWHWGYQYYTLPSYGTKLLTPTQVSWPDNPCLIT